MQMRHALIAACFVTLIAVWYGNLDTWESHLILRTTTAAVAFRISLRIFRAESSVCRAVFRISDVSPEQYLNF